MEKSKETKDYFDSCYTGTDRDRRTLYSRVGISLCRGGFFTMSQLCSASPEQIKKVRNIGKKSLAVVLEEREKYLKAAGQGEPSKTGGEP